MELPDEVLATVHQLESTVRVVSGNIRRIVSAGPHLHMLEDKDLALLYLTIAYALTSLYYRMCTLFHIP